MLQALKLVIVKGKKGIWSPYCAFNLLQGKSSKFAPHAQKVSLNHVVQDEDVVSSAFLYCVVFDVSLSDDGLFSFHKVVLPTGCFAMHYLLMCASSLWRLKWWWLNVERTTFGVYHDVWPCTWSIQWACLLRSQEILNWYFWELEPLQVFLTLTAWLLLQDESLVVLACRL
jgi:hypothetical protein